MSDSRQTGHWVTRDKGIAMASAWRYAADMTVLYIDHGVSAGMAQAEEEALEIGQMVERRSLAESTAAWLAGAYEPVKVVPPKPRVDKPHPKANVGIDGRALEHIPPGGDIVISAWKSMF